MERLFHLKKCLKFETLSLDYLKSVQDLVTDIEPFLLKTEDNIAGLRYELERHIEGCRMVGAICVQNNLPAGDPCWMAQEICEYF